jgi:Fanconi anemia group M protein
LHINHPLIKNNIIEARIYQQLVVANALKQNTLCVLGTGLGKTAIAALTIAGILSKRNGKVLIIAPSRPLVDQHQKSMNSFLNIDPEKIIVLNGKISPLKREEMWKTGKIFIATPQVAENDIISGILKTKDFSLLIADEAHHTTGNHSYTFVANTFKQNSHILGLTASPGSNIEKIMEICENLGVEHVEIKTEEDPDVLPYVAKVKMRPRKVELPKEFLDNLKLLKNALKERLTILKDNKVIYTINVNKSDLIGLNKKIMTMDDSIKYEMLKVSSEAVKIEHAIEMLETQGKSTFLNYYQKNALTKHEICKKYYIRP